MVATPAEVSAPYRGGGRLSFIWLLSVAVVSSVSLGLLAAQAINHRGFSVSTVRLRFIDSFPYASFSANDDDGGGDDESSSSSSSSEEDESGNATDLLPSTQLSRPRIKRDSRSKGGAASTETDAYELTRGPPSQLQPHLQIDAAANPVHAAYARILRAQLSLPPNQRSYLLARPESGWGNKVRALLASLRLAIAFRRILLLDDAYITPFFPVLFHPLYEPLLLSSVADAPTVTRITAAASDAASYLLLRNKHLSPLAECWKMSDAAHNLTACRDSQRQLQREQQLLQAQLQLHVASQAPGTAAAAAAAAGEGDVLVLETNQPVSSIIARSVDLQSALAAELGATVAGDSETFNRFAFAALLSSPASKLRELVAAQKAKMEWDARRVRVGVHVRLFVDSRQWNVPTRHVRTGWWECVKRVVRRAREEAGGASANDTLIFVASDKPSMKPSFGSHLGGLGKVSWYAPASVFVNSRDTKDISPLRTMLTDWLLLSDTDVMVGTERSSFTTAAAMRSGNARVIGSLKGTRCQDAGRVVAEGASGGRTGVGASGSIRSSRSGRGGRRPKVKARGAAVVAVAVDEDEEGET